MTFSTFDSSQRNAARVFGLTYLPFFVLLAAVNFGILETSSAGLDSAQIAQNILAHEPLFRIGLVGITLYSVGVIVLSVSLYVILKPINWGMALFATFSRFAHALIWLLVVLNLFTVLRLLDHPEYAKLPADQLPVFARLYLSNFDQYYVGLLLWSLASGTGAYLWLKSHYIHRVLAAFGILAGAWCVFCTIAIFVYPDFSKTVNLWWFDTPMVLFEIALSFLLLFRSIRSQNREPVLPQREARA